MAWKMIRTCAVNFRNKTISFSLLVLLGFMAFMQCVTAAEINVTTVDDVIDGSDGEMSLREAVIAANGMTGDVVINIPAGTYTMAIFGKDSADATTGDYYFDSGLDSIHIKGAGKTATIIDADYGDRIFRFANSMDVTIERMTLINGNYIGNSAVTAGANGAAGTGGGINIAAGIGNESYLLRDLIIQNCTATGGNGANGIDANDNGGTGGQGGVANGGGVMIARLNGSGSLEISRVTFKNNNAMGGAGGNGGSGLDNGGNTTGGVGGAGGFSWGGAMYIRDSGSGAIHISHSSFMNNTSWGGQPGVGGVGADGVNVAGGKGGRGGVSQAGAVLITDNTDSTSETIFDSVEFSGNSARGANGATGGRGAGSATSTSEIGGAGGDGGPARGGVAYFYAIGFVQFTGCTFTNNYTQAGDGGAPGTINGVSAVHSGGDGGDGGDAFSGTIHLDGPSSNGFYVQMEKSCTINGSQVTGGDGAGGANGGAGINGSGGNGGAAYAGGVYVAGSIPTSGGIVLVDGGFNFNGCVLTGGTGGSKGLGAGGTDGGNGGTAGTTTLGMPGTFYAVGDLCFRDMNADNVYDAINDKPLPNVAIRMYRTGDYTIARVHSDENGAYGFSTSFTDPGILAFALTNASPVTQDTGGDDTIDSDIDETTGEVAVTLSGDDVTIDAGFIGPAQLNPAGLQLLVINGTVDDDVVSVTISGTTVVPVDNNYSIYVNLEPDTTALDMITTLSDGTQETRPITITVLPNGGG